VPEYEERTSRWVEFQAACGRLAEVNAELDRRRLLLGRSGGRAAPGPEKGGSSHGSTPPG
ncbi:MAG: hypothetical protein WAS07_15970, partial [Micropruina sp.]